MGWSISQDLIEVQGLISVTVEIVCLTKIKAQQGLLQKASVLVILGKQVRLSFVLGFKKSDYLEYKESIDYVIENLVWFEVEMYGAQGVRVKLRFFRSTQQCMKSRVRQTFGCYRVYTVMGTLHQRLDYEAIDMLRFFGLVASILSKGLLDPVKGQVHILGIPQKYSGGYYKKTFIGSGVGTGSMQVLHRFEFEVEPLGDHTFEVEPQVVMSYQGAGLHCIVRKCSDDNDGYYLEYTPGVYNGKSLVRGFVRGVSDGLNCDIVLFIAEFD
ncbi:hypothetical protein Tco_0668122 [Tanacetum coccineum]